MMRAEQAFALTHITGYSAQWSTVLARDKASITKKQTELGNYEITAWSSDTTADVCL